MVLGLCLAQLDSFQVEYPPDENEKPPHDII
jgi:hypothetical protein